MQTLSDLAAALECGRTTSRDLAEACLARSLDPAGEGARAFVALDADLIRSAADEMDRLRRRCAPPRPMPASRSPSRTCSTSPAK